MKLLNHVTFSTSKMLFGCIIFFWKEKSNSIPHIKRLIKKKAVACHFYIWGNYWHQIWWWFHKQIYLFKVYTYCLVILFYFPLSSCIYSFLVSFLLKLKVSESCGWTCYIVCIRDLKKWLFEKYFTVQRIWQENFRTWSAKTLVLKHHLVKKQHNLHDIFRI